LSKIGRGQVEMYVTSVDKVREYEVTEKGSKGLKLNIFCIRE